MSTGEELDSDYHAWWQLFCTMHDNQRLPHALLLIAPMSKATFNFTCKMATTLLCSDEKKPCGRCKSCHLMTIKEHPDFYTIQPEKDGSVIKIDQIRALHPIAFTSPQLGRRRLILIYPAEKMNAAAANALLKLLEEPPDTVMFILISEQISTVLPTLLSRCQIWRLTFSDMPHVDYLTLGKRYVGESHREKVFDHYATVSQDLFDLVREKGSVCAITHKWAQYEFKDLVWLLYLINAQIIQYRFVGVHVDKNEFNCLNELAQRVNPITLFKQLDVLHGLFMKLNQNIAINPTLSLENYLFGFR